MVARSPDESRGGQKDAKIAHIKRRVPLGEKTTHIVKAQMQNEHSKAVAH